MGLASLHTHPSGGNHETQCSKAGYLDHCPDPGDSWDLGNAGDHPSHLRAGLLDSGRGVSPHAASHVHIGPVVLPL
jgi:hypothetical protein